MANQPSFQELFGGATANVDYSDNPGSSGSYLPMPEPTDSLDTTARKLRALAAIVESGKSMAVATGFKSAAHEERDPETLARQSMTPPEVIQYDAWKKGAKMPAFDFASNRKEITGGAGARARFERRAKAMNEIWGTEAASSENAMWLTANMSFAIPLVVAVAKVHGAQRELAGGQSELSEMELAEVQTTHKVVAVAMDNMNNIYRRLNEMARDINYSREVIQAREHAIKSKMASYKQRKDPINQDRTFVGLAPIGAGVDFGGTTGGKRAVRTNLLAGTGVDPSGASARPQAPPASRPNTRSRGAPSGQAMDVDY